LKEDKQHKIDGVSLSQSATEWTTANKQIEKELYAVGQSPVHEPSTVIDDSKVWLSSPN